MCGDETRFNPDFALTMEHECIRDVASQFPIESEHLRDRTVFPRHCATPHYPGIEEFDVSSFESRHEDLPAN
jgi:hypothetical protein